MVGGADDAFLLHLFDDPRGAVVADLQVPLDEAGRAFALAADQSHGLIVERVAGPALVVSAAGCAEPAAALVVLGDLVEIGRLAAALQEVDDGFDFLVGDERSVDAGEAAAA